MPIQVLDPIVAAKIAAGEVIERPASVIKELMDNCIDAGASEIRVEIRGGGQQFMRISDNGGGIAAADLPLAFVRHATSKIKTAEELFALHTLGFRGEALASVSAVGRVTISSHTSHDSVGSEMTVEGGQPGPVTPRGMPRGTIVTVRDLFFNVPVRLKFLKSAAAESAHISAIVQQYVLAYPAVRFVLVSDSKQVISSPGTGDLRDAIRQVYGQEVAGVMLPVGTPPDTKFRADEDPFADWNEDSSDTTQIAEPSAQPYQPSEKDEDVPVEVWGYISPPAVSRTNRQAQHFFVNGRTIGSRMLTFALEEAYHSLLMVGRHPIAVLNIRVHPGDVDANVHPTKSEVKFRQERAVFVALQRTVRQALSDHPTLPSFGTRGAEGWQVSQQPTEAAPEGTAATEASDGGEYKPAFNGGAEAPAPRQSGIFPEYGAPALSWSAFDGQANGAAPSASAPTDLDGPDESDRPEGAETAGAGLDPMPALPPLPPLPSGNRLPPLRVVGQVSNTYIIAEGPDGMFLIDQHAAHERILYEKLDREMRSRSVPIQAMLQPLKLDLSARQRADIEPILPLLEEVGFSVELLKGGRDNALLITAVPAMYNTRELAGDIMAMLDELLVGSPPDRWRDQLAITLACHSAIRAGKGLGGDEMRALVTQLESCTFPRLCAHGRPTVLHLSALQLEREFGRRG